MHCPAGDANDCLREQNRNSHSHTPWKAGAPALNGKCIQIVGDPPPTFNKCVSSYLLVRVSRVRGKAATHVCVCVRVVVEDDQTRPGHNFKARIPRVDKFSIMLGNVVNSTPSNGACLKDTVRCPCSHAIKQKNMPKDERPLFHALRGKSEKEHAPSTTGASYRAL